VARKLFAGTFALSAVLALIVGVAFAWTTSSSSSDSSTAGALNVTLYGVNGTSNALYPNATMTTVLTGQINNQTAANPGIAVHIADAPGTVSITDAGACPTAYLSGQVVRTDNSLVQPSGPAGGGWAVQLAMATDAPDTCQSAIVAYTYTINTTTN
jgi:hypothetical protein